MAAARSPGSTISASCMSARDRPARCPGPAAYGRGGTKATTTDANLWLGRINKDYFCGGEVAADMAAAEAAHHGGRRKARRRCRRGGARHHPHRQQQHGQRAEAGVAQSRPRSARLHAGRLRRRRRDACRGAGRRARRQEGRDPGRRVGVLGLGHDDVRPPPRLFRHAPRRSRKGAAARHRSGVRGDRGAGARRSSRRRASRPARCGSCAMASSATRTRSTRPRCCRRRQGHRRAAGRDRGGLPRNLRARIHLPARCAGRDGRHPSGRLGRSRQAHHAQARGDRRQGRGRAEGPAATSTMRWRASTARRSTMARSWSPA